MNCTKLWRHSWSIFGAFKSINGFLYNKVHDQNLISHTKKAKILGLLETQHTADDIDKLQLLDYKCFQVCHKKKRLGRKHGGIAVFVHHSILQGVTKIPTQGSEVIILKLNKGFFKLDRDTHLVFAYCSPSQSSYTIRTQLDPFSEIEQKLANLERNTDVIVMGDLNARTGLKLDYITHEDNQNLTLPVDYITDTVATFPRGNRDATTNQYGDSVIALCRNTPLRICNGRKLGDTQGDFTCHKWNGQSVVDYCLASPGVYSQILFLKVGNYIPVFSDHCSLTIALKTHFFQTQNCRESLDYDFLPKPTKLTWDKNIALKFENIIQSPESKIFIQNFAKNGILPDQNSVDIATDFLTDFLTSAAEKAANNGISIACNIGVKRIGRNWKFKRKCSKKRIQPKWHDASCESLSQDIKRSAALLKKYPNNSYLRGCIQSETKKYKKLLKSKHKEFINKLFKDLDNMHNNNPKGYMNLVKSLRDGTFDRKISDDASFVSPTDWRDHFSSLLGPPIMTSPEDQNLLDFVENNCDKFESELGRPFTLSEYLKGVSSLANNKAICFDRISNEILKTAKSVIAGPTIKLFNAILSSSTYPSQWKLDILSPIHKSGPKNDPNNFRGVAVSSCFGKLFNKLLQKRLEEYCQTNNFISNMQGSGKAGSRTSDHLLIVKFLTDKYVKQKGKRLYSCFVDLRKAFDTVPRPKLFYSLVKHYSIGGRFLKILKEIYKDNKIFVKLSDGLLQPFTTTISVKQGCVFSPILFNLYIDKICSIFDESCSPVQINKIDLNCLLWADDLLMFSKTAEGLQNCINKMQSFYEELDLKINVKKTKVIIFNKRGVSLDKKFNFYLGIDKLEITDQYQYLGIKLRPSGSLKLATDELHDKACRAWHSISNVIFRNKRMESDQVFGIFDSLVTPIATYGCEFWLPYLISKSGFTSAENLMNTWGSLKMETVNQKCSRTVLSVHNKASRLAVLGELGRYPLFIPILAQCLSYKLSLIQRKTDTNLLGHLWTEMTDMTVRGQDCWLFRVNKIEQLLNVPGNLKHNKFVGKKLSSILRGKFDTFWLKKINEIVTNKTDSCDHNKLRVYKQFKSSFTKEPYVEFVRNRNQRSSLTRLRISAHLLATELGRRTRQ